MVEVEIRIVNMPKVEEDIKRVKEALRAAIIQAVRRIAELFERELPSGIPVRTGKLAGSVVKKVGHGGEDIRVGVTTFYGPFVEWGTIRTRAQPFIRPLLEESIEDIKMIVQQEVGKAVSVK